MVTITIYNVKEKKKKRKKKNMTPEDEQHFMVNVYKNDKS